MHVDMKSGMRNRHRLSSKALLKTGFSLHLLAASALVAVMAFAPGVVWAQAAANGQMQRTSFDIAAQPLSKALVQYSNETGVQLFFDASIVRGKNSGGAKGSLTRSEALSHILSGSGLTYSLRGNTVTISAQQSPSADAVAPDGSLLLNTITVEGNGGQSAFGPVDGYLAASTSSATKMDTPLIETPQSVTVVTADQVRDQKATSIAQTLSYTPGVSAQSGSFSRMVDDLTIRGFNVASGNSGTLRDGMKLQSNVYDGGQEPYGLERVEVLRGASSVLYGQLSPGGVVNGVSKRPTDTPLHEVNVEYGSYNRKQLSADFGGPITSDGSLTYRLTGLLRDADNWVDNTPDDKFYIAPAVTWKPDEATSFTVLGSYQHIKTGFATPLRYEDVSQGTIPRDRFLGIEGFDKYNVDMYTVGGLFEHQFENGVKLRSNNRYFHSDVEWNYMFGNLAPSSNGKLTRLASERYETSYGATSDTSLEYAFNTGAVEHTIIGGFDYYRRSYDSNRYRGTTYSVLDLETGQYTGSPSVSYAVNRGQRAIGNQYGLYLQDQIKFDEHWTLLLGGRHDWSESTTTTYQNGKVTDQKNSAFTGRAGLVYVFDNGLAPYVSVSQSFDPQIGADVNGDALEPNKGLQYEAGIRYQPDGTDLMLSAAVFDLTQKNVVTYNSFGDAFQQGKVHSRGFELEARGQVGDLGLIAAYTFTDATIEQSAKSYEIGEQVALVPRHSFSIWADYDLDKVGVKGVNVGAGLRYVGKTNLPDMEQDVPAYTMVDAMVRFDLGAFKHELEGTSVTINARNLFDKKYYTCVAQDGCRYGEPLTVTATLGYKW